MNISLDKETKKNLFYSYLISTFPLLILIFGVIVFFGVVDYPKECTSSSRYLLWCQFENEIYGIVGHVGLGIVYIFLGGAGVAIFVRHMNRLKFVEKNKIKKSQRAPI